MSAAADSLFAGVDSAFEAAWAAGADCAAGSSAFGDSCLGASCFGSSALGSSALGASSLGSSFFGSSAFGASSCFGSDSAGFSADALEDAEGVPEPIRASGAPTSTVSSSSARCAWTMPATGEGTSVSTLSVETSSRGSSTSTSSPTSLSQRVTVPSVTDSPRAGIVTSVPSPESSEEDSASAGSEDVSEDSSDAELSSVEDSSVEDSSPSSAPEGSSVAPAATLAGSSSGAVSESPEPLPSPM